MTPGNDPSSYIGRFVVLLTPVFIGVSVIIANFVQDKMNVDLDETGIAAFLASVVLAVGAAVYKWLENRGKYEAIQTMAITDEVNNRRDNSASGALTKAGEPVNSSGDMKDSVVRRENL